VSLALIVVALPFVVSVNDCGGGAFLTQGGGTGKMVEDRHMSS